MLTLFSRPPGGVPVVRREPCRVGAGTIEVLFKVNPRARRYILRVRPDHTVQLTIPRRGTLSFAREFLHRHSAWLEQQLARKPPGETPWAIGTEIYFRGALRRIEGHPGEPQVRLGELVIPVTSPDLRREVELFLWHTAARELPAHVAELASLHGFSIRRVSVRNQRSRWGSCSRRGTISLNWRLIQVPPEVRDYIILHELAHVRHLNHSPAFWAEVQRLCPAWQTAERWLKQHRIR